MDDYVYIVKIYSKLVCSCQPDYMKLVTVLDGLCIAETNALKAPLPCVHINLTERFGIAANIGLFIFL